jgi:hypothetical protein
MLGGVLRKCKRAGGTMVVSPALQCGEPVLQNASPVRDGARWCIRKGITVNTGSRRSAWPCCETAELNTTNSDRFGAVPNGTQPQPPALPPLKCGANKHCASGAHALCTRLLTWPPHQGNLLIITKAPVKNRSSEATGPETARLFLGILGTAEPDRVLKSGGRLRITSSRTRRFLLPSLKKWLGTSA